VQDYKRAIELTDDGPRKAELSETSPNLRRAHLAKLAQPPPGRCPVTALPRLGLLTSTGADIEPALLLGGRGRLGGTSPINLIWTRLGC
jgi:hypothetical protein